MQCCWAEKCNRQDWGCIVGAKDGTGGALRRTGDPLQRTGGALCRTGGAINWTGGSLRRTGGAPEELIVPQGVCVGRWGSPHYGSP